MRTANAVMRGLRAASDACRTTAMHQMRATTASFEGAALYHCRSRAASGVAMPAVAMPATSLATRHGGVRGGFVTGGGVASRGAAERALPFALQTLRDISGCHVSAGKKDDGGDEKHADEKGAGILSDLLGVSTTKMPERRRPISVLTFRFSFTMTAREPRFPSTVCL